MSDQSFTHMTSLPYCQDILEHLSPPRRNSPQTSSDPESSDDSLPPTHRTEKNDIVAFAESAPELLAHMGKELLVDRLDGIHKWLWVAGLPLPPRPLHHQLVLNRNLVISEDPELHLVWTKNRIFIKPMPRFLLSPSFWIKNLICTPPSKDSCMPDCAKRAKLAATARGFLFSYAALISHESDYHIAMDNHLLPSEITWSRWKAFTKEFLISHDYSAVCPRYRYGELRIGRLNKLFRFRNGQLMRGYSYVSGYSFYAEFFEDNFGKLAAVLGYIVIVLTAMQVGLATTRLETNKSFQDVSYGFTVFSIVAPLAIALLIFVTFLLIFISNWFSTLHKRNIRLKAMGKGNA